jgi:hypothetical protein
MFVVEGEKDADNLARIGFITTCDSGGAKRRPPLKTCASLDAGDAASR